MKVINIKKEQILVVLYVSIIIFGIVTNYNKESVQTFSMPASKKVIVIDAGHGGFDPGKVGKDDVYEKDINLDIAMKLQKYFEQSGATIIMTRTEDSATAGTKNEDMRKRKEIVNKSKADILISIHQNSYEDPSVSSPQVFYYGTSESELLAKDVQKEMNLELSPKRERDAQKNDSYYILKETDIPAIIVECGFLSNPEEKALLVTDDYRDKIAWSIYVGTINYFSDSIN